MRPHLAVPLIVAAALAFTGGACGGSSAPDWSDHMGDVKFVVGWEKGLTAAKAGGKPLAIFFTADW